jgi:Fe-S-cluster containining protein
MLVPPRLFPLDHPRIRSVEAEVFVTRSAPNCIEHRCRCRAEGDRVLADACCRYGVDLALTERRAIEARAAEIAAVLHPAWRDPARWFDASEPEEDPDYPGGVVIRTAVQGREEDSGCVFLAHDARGCALHRAALAGGFDPVEIKPAVCRLFPLTVGDGSLQRSEDFELYSCADAPTGPTLYRLLRSTLADVFGPTLVSQLDDAERRCAAPPG